MVNTSPFLRQVSSRLPNQDQDGFPFNVPIFKDGFTLTFDRNVSIIVGENGTGKSTILEAIAANCGFNIAGGNRNHQFASFDNEPGLAEIVKLTWNTKTSEGFFFRAETFFYLANYIQELAKEDPQILGAYGGKSLHAQSHGEAFLSLFTNRFGRGLYILDEPESALSPKHQLSFLWLIKQLEQSGKAQFIIATHSPIILAYPSASVFQISDAIKKLSYKDTQHYQLMRDFINNPEEYFRHLFQP